MDDAEREPIAVLVSGGIDSAVLLAELCRRHAVVFPLFVRGGLVWEAAEFAHLQEFLRAIASDSLQPVSVLEQSVQDVYGDHWSVTGRDVPAADSPDEAVYLPGRNLFLGVKAGVWCVQHRVKWLALGSLEANPFADSTPEFDERLGDLIARAMGKSVRIVRPYASLSKMQVLGRGDGLPLEWTFSCIQPRQVRHCGQCNKCRERQGAFQAAGLADPTLYASSEGV